MCSSLSQRILAAFCWLCMARQLLLLHATQARVDVTRYSLLHRTQTLCDCAVAAFELEPYLSTYTHTHVCNSSARVETQKLCSTRMALIQHNSGAAGVVVHASVAAWICMHAAGCTLHLFHATVIIAHSCTRRRAAAHPLSRVCAQSQVAAAANMLPVRVCGMRVLLLINSHCTTASCNGVTIVCVFLCAVVCFCVLRSSPCW
jgi:hypothetical protein